MPAEIIDKLYEIAQKGGYAGDQPARWEGGIAAITSAITHDTPVLRDTVVDALDDLKTVAFEGGGGGGDYGVGVEIVLLNNNDNQLTGSFGWTDLSLMVSAAFGTAPYLPSGGTYIAGMFMDAVEDPKTITDASQVSATIKASADDDPVAFTDFEVVDFGGINSIQFELEKFTEGAPQLTFVITPDEGDNN